MPFPYLLPINLAVGTAEKPRITDSILASGLQNSEHIKAYDIAARNRFEGLDLNPLMIYLIDTVPAAALPHLAEQFNILGYKGWRFAKTETQQRDLLKQAIELHRFKGTPWSIKEAIKRAGYSDSTILEGVGQYYDGTFLFNGSVTYNGLGNWACFRVIFNLGNDKGISSQETIDIQELVKEYKNARSTLVDISFIKGLEDNIDITEDLKITVTVAGLDEEFSGITYNAVYTFNGTQKYNSYGEDITGFQ